ncbi:MAG: glycosyltransferase [Thermoleophilia bacterium]|nr:glycosyltransferase [Thermoleophilia bacterium]
MKKPGDLKVLAVIMQWDYADPTRGRSCEDSFFVDHLRPLVGSIDTMWIDDYITSPALLQSLLDDTLARIRATQPDLVFFVPFQMEFAPEALDRIRELCPTMAWFSDDQWRFDDHTSRLAPHYTWVCTTDRFRVDSYRAIGVEPILSQWGGRDMGAGSAPLPPDGDFAFDVSFVGGRDAYRDWMVHTLEGQGVSVTTYGAGWPNGRVFEDDMPAVFRESRINLNLSNSRNHDIRFVNASPANQAYYGQTTKVSEQPKARHFEIALAGGFQLSSYFVGMEDFFVIGDEIAIFTTPEECALQIKRFLAEPERRYEIALASWERARRDHTWDARMRGVLDAAYPSTLK